MKRTAAFVIALVALFFAACDGEGGGGGDAVVYQSVQTDIDGKETAYELSMTPMREGLYEMVWRAGDEEKFSGYGLEFGEDLLAVGYAPATLKHYVGVYRMGDGGLAGRWTNGHQAGTELAGRGVEPPEVLAWDLPTKFDFQGVNPDGSPYTGYLNVAVFGTGPEKGVMITQHTEVESYQGRALYTGDAVVVVYQLGLTLTVQYYEKTGDEWSGEWFAEGAMGIGTETMRPAE
jgi:hypothetical protein